MSMNSTFLGTRSHTDTVRNYCLIVPYTRRKIIKITVSIYFNRLTELYKKFRQ